MLQNAPFCRENFQSFGVDAWWHSQTPTSWRGNPSRTHSQRKRPRYTPSNSIANTPSQNYGQTLQQERAYEMERVDYTDAQ